MAARYELIPVTVTGALTCGVLLGLLTGIQLPLGKRLGMSEARARLLPYIVTLSLVPSMLLSGFISDRWGVQWVLIGGSLLGAVAVAGLALSQTYPTTLGITALLGTAASGIAIGSAVLMPFAFSLAHPLAALNLGTLFFVVGSLGAPWLSETLLERIGFRRSMGLLALLALAPALAVSLTTPDLFPAAQASDLDPLTEPVLWTAGLACLLYGPIEALVAGWIAPFLTGLGYRERRAAWLLAGFWVMFLAGRVLAALFLERRTMRLGVETGLLVALVLGAAILMGNLSGTTSRETAGWGLLVMGLCLGPVFPSLLGLVAERYSFQCGTVFGALFALCALGSVLAVAPSAAFARRMTVQKALRIPTVLALGLVMALIVFALFLTEKK
jgi:hypothetical protein